jgi:hypothetical protein
VSSTLKRKMPISLMYKRMRKMAATMKTKIATTKTKTATTQKAKVKKTAMTNEERGRGDAA